MDGSQTKEGEDDEEVKGRRDQPSYETGSRVCPVPPGTGVMPPPGRVTGWCSVGGLVPCMHACIEQETTDHLRVEVNPSPGMEVGCASTSTSTSTLSWWSSRPLAVAGDDQRQGQG
jgi:hypothetical protein